MKQYALDFQLRQHSFPLSYDLPPFAFVFKDRYPVEGWNVYNPVSELKRLGLPNESWKISKINDQYQICDTYPRVLGVPKLASDEDIAEVAKFRSKGRFPVLSWMHPDSLATICRCVLKSLIYLWK
jgi:myotubularin-related protein 1/2